MFSPFFLSSQRLRRALRMSRHGAGLFLGLLALLHFAGVATASTVASAAQLTPRNFTSTVSSTNAVQTLTVSFTLANTGAAAATSVRMTRLKLLNSAGTQPAGALVSPVSLPSAVGDIATGGAETLSVQFSGVTPGQKTRFSIAFSSAASPATSTGFYLTIPTAAVTPIALTATPGNGSVTLTFNAQPNISYYNVYETTTTNAPLASYTYIGYTSSTTYTQSNLANGTTYYYYVVPVNNGGTGAASNVASVLVSLPAPTNLTATAGDGQITLNWTASTGLGVQYYEVYQTTTAGAALSTYKYIGYTSSTTYTQSNLANGTTAYYYFKPTTMAGYRVPPTLPPPRSACLRRQT